MLMQNLNKQLNPENTPKEREKKNNNEEPHRKGSKGKQTNNQKILQKHTWKMDS